MEAYKKTHYYYRVTLRNDKLKEFDEKGEFTYIIWYRGEMKRINHSRFEWAEEEPITYKEALKIMEGTVGVNTISGEFKIKENEVL